MSDAVSCSRTSESLHEQLPGSAPQAVAWVALEQNGPWGARAFSESHLDPELGRSIEALAQQHESRAVLIRRPGRHADPHDHGSGSRLPRTVLLAHTRPGATWLLEGSLPPDALIDLDWTALERGDADAVRRSAPALRPSRLPQLLVCTNGTRDVCCAVTGRPVAAHAAALRPGHVWEVTHTSGHRFAPTGVVLPAGTLHGRLTAASAVDLLDRAARGRTVLAGNRGRSTWAGPAQVAELAVRDCSGETSLDALTVRAHRETGPHSWTTELEHADGRRWQVDVVSEPTEVRRPESCGKAATMLRRYRTTVR